MTELWCALDKKVDALRSDNKKTIVFVICLLIATLFWLLTALNDEYRTELVFPIEFSNLPKHYAFYGTPPEQILVTVEGEGFSIVRYKFSPAFSSLKFDVSKNLVLNEADSAGGHIILQETALKRSVENALIAGTEIVSVQPESISISYSKLEEKKLPVKVPAEITTARQHLVNGAVTTYPDSVLVLGTKQQLAEITAIYTRPVQAQNLEDTLRRNLALQAVDGLRLSAKKVKLTVPVEAYTEKTLEVPIVGRGFPDSLRIRTFPAVAKVSCICGLSVYNQVKTYDFSCYIDYATVAERSVGNVKLSVESNSQYAQRLLLRTESVDYLIERRVE